MHRTDNEIVFDSFKGDILHRVLSPEQNSCTLTEVKVWVQDFNNQASVTSV